jgi:hypothetical protein
MFWPTDVDYNALLEIYTNGDRTHIDHKAKFYK